MGDFRLLFERKLLVNVRIEAFLNFCRVRSPLAIIFEYTGTLTVVVDLPCSEEDCYYCSKWQIMPIDDAGAQEQHCGGNVDAIDVLR